MWFRVQRIATEPSEAVEPTEEAQPSGRSWAPTRTIAVKPADFQRVRLLHQEVAALQSMGASLSGQFLGEHDDWTKINDARERERIQNRVLQREYRTFPSSSRPVEIICALC